MLETCLFWSGVSQKLRRPQNPVEEWRIFWSKIIKLNGGAMKCTFLVNKYTLENHLFFPTFKPQM